MKRFNFYIAILTAFITIVTFGIALFTPPISGPFCPDSCIEYPYNDIGSRFPRDYLWMHPAILSALLYVVLVICINRYSAENKKIRTDRIILCYYFSCNIDHGLFPANISNTACHCKRRRRRDCFINLVQSTWSFYCT
jgi:hypothetical protein